jgi:2-polyprenyl-6-methoxyphenol hydroxylase-like FAD-dependent oxidoreductase
MSTVPDAMVVGAGPAGLSMGAALASQGLRIRVIDSGTGPVKESRALGSKCSGRFERRVRSEIW